MKKIGFIICLSLFSFSVFSQSDNYQKGLDYAKKGDYTNALKYYFKAANKGDDKAQFELGLMYQTGKGVTKNTPEAIKWWQQAANQGNVFAQYSLGVMYDLGDGVNENNVEAKKWYLKAAEQGNDNAQLNLGILYADGEGIPQDYNEAFKWFTKASNQGNANALDCLAKLYLQGNGTEKDLDKAEQLFLSSAEKGNKNAMNTLGRQYLMGNGFAKDYQKAEMWLKKAIEKDANIPYPYSNLALLYAQRDKNYQEALRYSDMALARMKNCSSKKQAELYGERGQIYILKGDKYRAEEMLAKCLELNPDYQKGDNEFSKMIESVHRIEMNPPIMSNTDQTQTKVKKSVSTPKHLAIMGIPITGNIATFQQKLLAKNYRVDAKSNKELPVGQRAFKGRFSGHECSLRAYYFPDDKTVYKVRVSVDFLNESNADNAYKEIKRNLLRKYKNSDTKTKRTDGHESLHLLVIDDEDEMLGFIDLIVFEGDDTYESELVVGYTDMDGFAKEEKKHTDDL